MLPRSSLLLASILAVVHSQGPPQDCSSLPKDAFVPHTLRNSRGLELHVLSYGGVAQSLYVPRAGGGGGGPPLDVLLGFDDPTWYCTGGPMDQHPYFGALIGRVVNRIARCKFTLDGTVYTPPCNEFQPATGLNDTLHGGTIGYDRRVWNITDRTPTKLVLELDSPDGEMGFPSSLHLTVTYQVTEPPQGSPPEELGAWDIQYAIVNTGTLPTPAAPTNHAYFMLSGFDGEETVLGHTLAMKNATQFEVVDKGLIPTGALVDVTKEERWMDFTAPKVLGKDFPLPSGASGYDNAWIFANYDGAFLPQADITSPISHIRMLTFTDAPSVQM